MSEYRTNDVAELLLGNAVDALAHGIAMAHTAAEGRPVDFAQLRAHFAEAIRAIGDRRPVCFECGMDLAPALDCPDGCDDPHGPHPSEP